MRFLSVYKTVERGVSPTQEEMAKMGKLIEEGMKAGFLLAVEGCMPSAAGARVRLSNGKLAVTDGPFTDRRPRPPAGELEGRGYRIDQAIPQRSRDGECELRQLHAQSEAKS
jgi:hypothetical protein